MANLQTMIASLETEPAEFQAVIILKLISFLLLIQILVITNQMLISDPSCNLLLDTYHNINNIIMLLSVI